MVGVVMQWQWKDKECDGIGKASNGFCWDGTDRLRQRSGEDSSGVGKCRSGKGQGHKGTGS